jgi:hypothetical protein
MKARRKIRRKPNAAGIALLISIFILLLISVVAIALIVSSSAESSLAGNYRSATGVYYAALGGLEEARGRLAVKDPNSFNNTAPGFLPSPGNTMAIGAVAYVLNPGPTEVSGTLLATYPDLEYDTEFGAGALGGATVTMTASVWNRNPLNTLPFPAPLYKWVRINAVSEKSLNLDVAPYDSFKDPATPVFYDGTQLNVTNTGVQVLEITSLAVLPNGSQKLVQYLAAQTNLGLSFPSALTLVGNNAQFDGPNWIQYLIDGKDQYAPPSSPCTPGSPVWAIGYTNSSSHFNIVNGSGISSYPSNYFNGGPPSPNVKHITLLPNLQTPGGLDALVQTIEQNADSVIPHNALPSDLPYTDDTHLKTIVVEGDLNLVGTAATGDGLLLVTGNFTYDAAASWRGIVLVIGKGNFVSTVDGSGEFDGAVLVAQTRDSSGNLFTNPSMMTATFSQTTKAHGIFYSSCWVQASMPAVGYKILSFHEISQ